MERKRTKIILAWDKSTFGDREKALLDSISPHIDYVKVGLEAMTAEDAESGETVARKVREFCIEMAGLDVMWDMKLSDIQATVVGAVRNIMQRGSGMFTLHATCSDETFAAVAELTRTMEHASLCQPLAVTVLTDLGEEQCVWRFGDDPSGTVLRFARNVLEHGITGLVCSPKELPYLRKQGILEKFTSVIPGVRPSWAAVNDQKRVMTPAEAAQEGADYIVIGRPILSADDPLEAAKRIRAELDEAVH